MKRHKIGENLTLAFGNAASCALLVHSVIMTGSAALPFALLAMGFGLYKIANYDPNETHQTFDPPETFFIPEDEKIKTHTRLKQSMQRVSQKMRIPPLPVLHTDTFDENLKPTELAALACKKSPYVTIQHALAARLNDDELDAVLAHEMAHFKSKHAPKGAYSALFASTAFFGAAISVAASASQNLMDVFALVAYPAAGLVIGSRIMRALKPKPNIFTPPSKAQDQKALTAGLCTAGIIAATGIAITASTATQIAVACLVGTALVSHLTTFMLSRRHEYSADAVAASCTSPDTMKSALKNTNPLNTLLTKISSGCDAPKGFRTDLKEITSTHPSDRNRFKALDALKNS